jgi:hypothetical protein
MRVRAVLTIVVQTEDDILGPDTDESYDLNIDDTGTGQLRGIA